MKHFLFLLVTILQPIICNAIPIDNEIIGNLNITCLENSVLVNFKTKNVFKGRVYIRGSYDVPNCNADFSANLQENAVMSLPFTDCNSRRERLLTPGRGIMHVATVIVSFHPLFITKVDRAYRIECVYKSIDMSVTNFLDISMIPTIQYNFAPPPPVCSYDLRLGNVTGPEIRYVNVGDSVYHHWTCDSELYIMFVHSCYVSTTGRPTVQLVNSNGCSLDKNIMQNITYSFAMNEAWVETHAFTYQDVTSLRFNCKISMCLKTDTSCIDEWSTVCLNVDASPSVKSIKHVKRNIRYELNQKVFSDNLIVSDTRLLPDDERMTEKVNSGKNQIQLDFLFAFAIFVTFFVFC